MVGWYTLSKDAIRVRNKNKNKRRKIRAPNPGKMLKKLFLNHINLKSNNFTESFSKKLGHSLPQYNLCEKKLPSIQQTVLSKLDVFLLPETKIDNSFPVCQFFSEGFKMYRKDRPKNGGGLLVYLNKNLPGTIIKA